MITRFIPEVGDRFPLKSSNFYFNNKYGGTGCSNWEYDNKYTGPTPVVEITKVWYDDEVGYRCWSIPINKELIEYMEQNAMTGDIRIFISEHDIKFIADAG